jgi:MAE_28990/MAE_18760-like HEPN
VIVEIWSQFFVDRVAEIDDYLDFLSALEKQIRNGVSKSDDLGLMATPGQQRILYSSVYLQLYNLVEATINKCIQAVCSTIIKQNRLPANLSADLQREWVRVAAKTHTDLNHENRLKEVTSVLQFWASSQPIAEFNIEKGGGGNWDDEAIYGFSRRLGFTKEFSPSKQSGETSD